MFGFSVTGSGWSASTPVAITIPPEVAGDPTRNEDGAGLVGNLQMRADGTSHLGTPSTVQVHITLVHPTACLKVYNFLTAQDDSTLLTSAVLNLGKDGKVKGTNPGQFSDAVLVVNTCGAAQAVGLQVALDPAFQTNPANNPGNAVFTYLTTGEVDPSSFDLDSFGTGTPQGQQLCLDTVTVPAGDTFLTTVHTEIQKGILRSTSPATFSAALSEAGSGCVNPLGPLAEPNQAGATLSFTSK